MNPWHTPVDRGQALRLICPLPDGHVAGVQQVARRGDVAIIASLTQTIRQDTWNGVRIAITSTSGGEVAANWFGFAEHQVFDQSTFPRGERDRELDRLNQRDLLSVGSIRAHRLRDAVEVYTGVFAPPPDPAFTASARLEGLFALAQHLDHLDSTEPGALAGRALIHAEVLREVANEIHTELLPLAGERQAADGLPTGLTDGLANLHTMRDSLSALALGADAADHRELAEVFRFQAGMVGGIAAEIQADLTRTGQSKARAAMARTTAGTAASKADAPPRRASGAGPSGPGRGRR
ncbi:hypothetical protein [Streptacidiphilus sp. MAP5-52]|uniref:hypothetical protein n=1 Tax=Streptacidiphilus sp. MAP5-52 TaxID=3156267 RepID=UPI003513B07A